MHEDADGPLFRTAFLLTGDGGHAEDLLQGVSAVRDLFGTLQNEGDPDGDIVRSWPPPRVRQQSHTFAGP